ncbi:MAG TPA: hypothetical protein ENG39_01035, partial [Candidatus Omnitrophica bacterium]|nr:hypothetical protein [Candidatus Omnitrophota bacterium]
MPRKSTQESSPGNNNQAEEKINNEQKTDTQGLSTETLDIAKLQHMKISDLHNLAKELGIN